MLLVTGITGHTGRFFLEELKNNKYEGEIRCIVRSSSDTKILDDSGLKIEKVYGDINDEILLEKAIQGVDRIVHIYNIKHSLNILKVASKNNVKQIIAVHTTGIYSKYKIASEEYILIEKEIKKFLDGKDIKMTILRPTMIFGDICDRNMSKFIKMICKFRIFPIINNGKNLIQPVNARDLGKSCYTLLNIPFEIIKEEYIISGEAPITMREAFGIISKKLGKKTIFINVPLGIAVLFAKSLKIVSLKKIDYLERVQRMGENRNFPHLEATSDFGYNPESFELGIEREIKEYLKDCRGL